MYYELSEFYKRDVYFVFDIENNSINRFSLVNDEFIQANSPLKYKVNKIDNYINEYDILPTFDAPLVSSRFKNSFEILASKNEVQFIDVIISDDKGNENNNFFALIILNSNLALDKERSVFEVDEDNFYTIKKAYFIENALEEKSIIRMKEHKSYIIVTEEFKRICEDANLKGFNFIEEGHSIYTDL
jgi:hypothetical protein